MTTLNMDSKFGNLMKGPPQKPLANVSVPFNRQQFNIQNGKRASVGPKQAKKTNSSSQNRPSQGLRHEDVVNEMGSLMADVHSRAQHQNIPQVAHSFQEPASSTINSGTAGAANIGRNDKMDQISGHPYRVIKYNNVSFQQPAKTKLFHDPNDESSVYNQGKLEQQYLVHLGRSSEMQGQLLKLGNQNAKRGESKASSALSHMSQNVNAEKAQLNAVVMKQPSSSCSKTQMGSLTDKRKYRSKIPQQQKAEQNQGRASKGANIVPINHHKPNMSHHHSNSSNFSNQNFVDKNLTMNIYQSGFALKNIAGSAMGAHEGGPTLINMAMTQKAIQNNYDEHDSERDIKLFGVKQQSSAANSLKKMDVDAKSKAKVASLEPDSSLAGAQRSILDKTSLLGAPPTNAYASNLTSFHRIQSMSSKQAKLSAKAQQQMPLKGKKSAQAPLLIKQSSSKDQSKNAPVPAMANANLVNHTQGSKPVIGKRTEEGSGSVPSGSQNRPCGISFNSSQQLRGNFYQTQVLKINNTGDQTALGGTGKIDERQAAGEKTQIRLSESQGPIGMVKLNATESKVAQIDKQNIELMKIARAKSKQGHASGTASQLSHQSKKVFPASKPAQMPEDYGQKQKANNHLLATSSYSNDQQNVLKMANVQNQRTNSLEDITQRNQSIKIQNQQLSLMNQKQLKIQKNHIIYKAPQAAMGNQYMDHGENAGVVSSQVTNGSKSSLNERSREMTNKQQISPKSQSQFYLNLLQIQKPSASTFNETQTAAIKKNERSPHSPNSKDRTNQSGQRYDEYDQADTNSYNQNEATVESKGDTVASKSNNTNRGPGERSSYNAVNGKNKLQSDRYKSNRTKADAGDAGLGPSRKHQQNDIVVKKQLNNPQKMQVYNVKPIDDQSLEDFRYGMAPQTQLSHIQSKGAQAEQFKKQIYGRPYAQSQLARSSTTQHRQQFRQSQGAKIKANQLKNQPQAILLNLNNDNSQQHLRGADVPSQNMRQASKEEAHRNRAVLFEAHNQNLLNILIKEPKKYTEERNSPEKDIQQRPQLKRVVNSGAGASAGLQSYGKPGEHVLLCQENEMMNATAPINMRQIQPENSSRNQTELAKRSSLRDETQDLQEEPMVTNAMVRQRQDSGVSSSLAMQKKNQKSYFTKAPSSNKQDGPVSRKSQNHLKSNHSKNGDQLLFYSNCKDLELSERKIQSQSKLSQMHVHHSKTKVNTQNIVSPMDYAINESFRATSSKPDSKMHHKVNSSSQNTINHEFLRAGQLKNVVKGQSAMHHYPQKQSKGKMMQDTKTLNASDAVIHTGNSATSQNFILVDGGRHVKGNTGNAESSQGPYTKDDARPSLLKTTAMSKMAGNQLNTPSSDEDEVYRSRGKESGHQEELRVEETVAGLADDDQDVAGQQHEDDNDSQEPMGILDEDINNQIELLDQLQQLNSLDQSMLNEEQIQQFNELVQIKKDLEKNIWDKERQQRQEEEQRVMKDFELNSTQGMATRMMIQMQQEQEEAQLLDRLRGSDFSGTQNQNCNAIQVGGVSVEIEEAGTILDSANFADYAQTNSNVLSFINTGNLSYMNQLQKVNVDGYRQGASSKRKKSQRPTPQCQDTLKRPIKASKSQASSKTRTKQGTQRQTRDNQQAQSNKMMNTYINQGRNATAQHVLPEQEAGLDAFGHTQDGQHAMETLQHQIDQDSLGDTQNNTGTFLPNNMSIKKNSQINKKAEVNSNFTVGSRSKSSVNCMKLMKTTSHLSTSSHQGQDMAASQVMHMKEARVVQVPNQFTLNQTQPISKMKLTEHGLDAGSLMNERRGQKASCSSQILGAEPQMNTDNKEAWQGTGPNHQVDRPYQERPEGQEIAQLEENEDMDIDLILGHYEYQNFTDQVIESKTQQDEVEKDALNYFKIQKDNEIQTNSQQQESQAKAENVADQTRYLNEDGQRSRQKNWREQKLNVSKQGAAQTQPLAKSKRSHLHSKRLSTQMGEDYNKSNQGQQQYSQQRPSSQADVSLPSTYQKNLMALHGQLMDPVPAHQKPYDLKMKTREGLGSEKKSRGLGGPSQNNFAPGNVAVINNQADAKKKIHNVKGQILQKLNPNRAIQTLKPQGAATLNVSGQVPPNMVGGIRNKFNKNMDQVVLQAPAESSLNKKKRSNSRQKQRSTGTTQGAFNPNSNMKQQKLSRNNNNDHLAVKRAQRGTEKHRKSSLHSQGSQPGQGQLTKAIDTNVVDIKTMLNESQKIASAVMLAHESAAADSAMQQRTDLLVAQANRQANPQAQPHTSSKVDLVKMIQKPQIVDQALNDSQGNPLGQALNKRGPAARQIQRQLEQPNIISAQINGKKVKIAKSTKHAGPLAIGRAIQPKKMGNLQQPRQRMASTETQLHPKPSTQSHQLQDKSNKDSNAQNYQNVMKTLMDLCNQTQNIRNINDSYRQQMPQQMQLVNDYSSQDNIERVAHPAAGDMLIGAEQSSKVAVSQSHNFKNAKQKMAGQGQARNATLSNSRRASNAFLSQQSKEDIVVLNNMLKNLGSLDQNQENNNKHTLGSSTGTINYRGGAAARAESQHCAQTRQQSQQISKLQSGMTTQLLHEKQVWGAQHQQASQSKVVGRSALNKSPNQPHSLLNTSSNLQDFLKKNKLSIVSQNPNHGVGGGLGSTYAPGGLGFGQIRTLMKLPTFQSSQMNNYGKTTGNFAAHRILKAAQAARGSYHQHHQSSGNHSSLLGTLKGGIGIMPNLSNAEFNNENLNESMRDFELALEHFAGSTGNMQHVLQKANNPGPIVAGGLENLRGSNDFNGTQHITFANNQMKLSDLFTNLQGLRAEPDSGSVTITNNDAAIQEPSSKSQKKAQKTYQLAQQPMSNLRIHKRQELGKQEAITSETQQLQETPLIRELFQEANAEVEEVDQEFINTDQEEEKNRYRHQVDAGYDSDTDQSAKEHNDGQHAKEQFYQVQKLHLKDTSGLDEGSDEPLQRLHEQNDQAYSGDVQIVNNNAWQKNNKPNHIAIKAKIREKSNSSQKGVGAAKAGQIHLIPKQLVQAARGQAQRAAPDLLEMKHEGLESEEQLRIGGQEETTAKSNQGRQIERLSSSGSNMKKSGPQKPTAPKASGTSLLRQNSRQGGAIKGAYSTAAKRDMLQGTQIITNSSAGQCNENSKISSGQAKSRVRTTSKPQRLSSGQQKESKQSQQSIRSRHTKDNNSPQSKKSIDSGCQPPKMINLNAANNLARAKDEQQHQYQTRSPLNSGSKLLKKAMRDIKLENNINLRESEKDISGVSAASDVDDGQLEEQSVPSHNSNASDDSADDVKDDDEQVYNDKYYEMNQRQRQEGAALSKQDRETTKKRIEQLKEDLDEKMKERYQPYQTDGGHHNDRRQKNKNSNSQFSKQNSNNQILIDHNSAYNPSQVGDAEDGVAAQENRVHNYQFGRQIGEGAYAVVRSATSREDNEKYAIKIYDKSKLSDINRQRSVRREVVLLQKMNHPNIVKLVEAFETDSHVYLVMENVTGGSLHSYLKEMINKQLDEEEARRIFQQILVALKYCHSKCIAHRDIKLENVLLDESKNVKLIDFGFSTCIPNHKKIRMFCGTPSYMAPQIVSKVEYAGPPADIWATGVLLYALLNGCFPFRGQTDEDLYRRIKRGTYHIYNQKVTREYLDILQRCLDVNDDTRPSAKDLLDDPWFKINDIKQKAYEEEKRQFKAKILAKVPIIKKTNHTICILAQNPTDVLNKAAKRNENERGQIQQEDEQKNMATPAESNANQNQAYNQTNAQESPCMGQGLQGTQTRMTGESQADQLGSSNTQPMQNPHPNTTNSAQSSQSNHQPYQNNFNKQKHPADAQLYNNGTSENSANGADYKDQVVQQNLGKTQQQLTVGVYEGNLIGGANIQSGKADGFPRTIILNQNPASLLSGPALPGQDPASSAALQQQQAASSSSGQPGAIVLSYGAAVAPQIHVYQLKKKLNHEAYQAYYNTSSATGGNSASGANPALTRTGGPAGVPPPPIQGMSALGPIHLNVQSSPMAGPTSQTLNNNKIIN